MFRGWVGEDGFMVVSNKNSSVKECYIYIYGGHNLHWVSSFGRDLNS